MSGQEINYDSDSGFTEEEKKQIAEEIDLVFAITEGTMPMARGLGLSPDILDKGMTSADSPLIAEIMDKVEAIDDRISISEIKIEHNENGEAKTTVVIERRDST